MVWMGQESFIYFVFIYVWVYARAGYEVRIMGTGEQCVGYTKGGHGNEKSIVLLLYCGTFSGVVKSFVFGESTKVSYLEREQPIKHTKSSW